ncbi:hypothetical protein CGK36_23510, partial [Vibrio parahaemolyticus]
MSGYLTKIETKIPFSNNTVGIDISGKTLIITGGNGCGKTQLLNYIFQQLNERVINKNNTPLANLERDK